MNGSRKLMLNVEEEDSSETPPSCSEILIFLLPPPYPSFILLSLSSDVLRFFFAASIKFVWLDVSMVVLCRSFPISTTFAVYTLL